MLIMATIGLPPFGLRDGGLCWPHYPTTLQNQAQAFYLHIREPNHS